MKIDKNGLKHLYVKGSLDYNFSKEKENSIFKFDIYAFNDSYFTNLECQIYELYKSKK